MVSFEQSSGTPMERAFFHALMVLASCYGAMILTGWGKTNGEPVVSKLMLLVTIIKMIIALILMIGW